MKSVNKHLDLKKVTKNNAKTDSFSISLRRSNQMNFQHDSTDTIGTIAKRLKRNLTMATKKLTDAGPQEDVHVVSESDWSVKKPQLKNLQLLRQYLTFVSNETYTIVNKQEKSIQFDFDSNPAQDDSSNTTSRLGASIIENIVHNNNSNDNNSNEKKPLVQSPIVDRRRPGRPPKPKMFFDDKQAMIVNKPRIIRQKKQDIIKCICDTPQDEFGGMVQCDDCLSWLHVDCLDLDEDSLDDSYRCPPCCVSLGKPVKQLMASSMTWRYEAQLKSQRLAAAIQETSDEDEDDEDDLMTTIHTPNTNNSTITNTTKSPVEMEYDMTEQPIDMNMKLPIRINTSSAINYTIADSPISSRSTTPEDWSDASSESRYSTSSSSSTSEVSTPKDHLYIGDPFEQGNLVIDPESFELLSRLAYLQKLKDDLFSPSATDVFLCENNTNTCSVIQPDSSSQQQSLFETLPSTICSQELSEFSFDNGPFWQPLN